jgi:hypothetical protein
VDVKKEFEIGLAQRNHKELLGKLKAIAEKPQTDNGLKEAIESQSRLIKEFLTQISNQPKPQTPNVSVETNQDKVVNSISEMQKNILEELKANTAELKKYNNRPLVTDFQLVKAPNGYTSSVKLIYDKKK